MLCVYVNLSCFKQLPLNLTLILVPNQFNEGLRKLLSAEEGVILSADNPLDFYDKT